MQNWYAIEIEAAFHRQEWERAAAADAQGALTLVERVKPRRMRFPRLNVSGLTWQRLALLGSSLARLNASHQTAARETSSSFPG